jgi:hypothetical protein
VQRAQRVWSGILDYILIARSAILECVALVSPTINFYCESKHIKLLIYYFATRALVRRGRQAVRNFNVTRASAGKFKDEKIYEQVVPGVPPRKKYCRSVHHFVSIHVHCVRGNAGSARRRKKKETSATKIQQHTMETVQSSALYVEHLDNGKYGNRTCVPVD